MPNGKKTPGGKNVIRAAQEYNKQQKALAKKNRQDKS